MLTFLSPIPFFTPSFLSLFFCLNMSLSLHFLTLVLTLICHLSLAPSFSAYLTILNPPPPFSRSYCMLVRLRHSDVRNFATLCKSLHAATNQRQALSVCLSSSLTCLVISSPRVGGVSFPSRRSVESYIGVYIPCL